MVPSLKSRKQILCVTIMEPNGRLDKVILNAIPKDLKISRSRIKNLIKMGHIKTAKGGERVHQKYQVKENEELFS